MRERSENKRYVPAQEAANALGVHISTLRLWAARGRIDAICTPGRHYRYDIEGFLARARAATQAKLEREAKKLDVRDQMRREKARAERLAKLEERRKLAEAQRQLPI